MVAPFVIAGLGALGGIAIGAIANVLGKAKKIYGVAFIVSKEGRDCVCGKTFSDDKQAMQFQEVLAKKGHPSILFEKESEKSIRYIRTMAAGGKTVSGLGVGARDFDTNEEALEVTQATTRLPTSAWAKRARDGPYPETNPGHQDYMPEAPLFRGTTSSHEWKSEVDTWPVPDKFFPGHKGTAQPDELVVEQALQYPEPARGPSASDMISPSEKARERAHGQLVREAARSDFERGREHGRLVREAAQRK